MEGHIYMTGGNHLMKKMKYLAFGLVAAILAVSLVPVVHGFSVAYAYAFKCSKCGEEIDCDHHDPSVNQQCPEGGIHAWAPGPDADNPTPVKHDREQAQQAKHEVTYRCTKCGKEIHRDPHESGIDQACPEKGIHSWVRVDNG